MVRDRSARPRTTRIVPGARVGQTAALPAGGLAWGPRVSEAIAGAGPDDASRSRGPESLRAPTIPA